MDTSQAPVSSDDAETVLANTPFLLTRCSSDLRYVFVSKACAAMLGRRAEDLAGKKIVEVIGEQAFQTILPHIKAVLAGKRVEYEESVHYQGVGPRLVHVMYTPDTDRIGNVRGWIASIIDITEKRLAQERIAADLQATTLLRDVAGECVRADATLDHCLKKILDAAINVAGAQKGNLQLLDPASKSLRIAVQLGFGKPFLDFFQAVDDHARSACAAALQSGAPVIVADVLTSDVFVGQPSLKILRDEDIRAVVSGPLSSSQAHILGRLSVHFRETHEPQARELHLLDLLARIAADYLERKRAEEREQLLVREVQHRSNNLLAVVQAIAHGSLSGPDAEVFEARLFALANSNRSVIKSADGHVAVRQIVEAQIDPFAGRIILDGPPVAVPTAQAHNLGLVIHELLTNATKYGALSNTSGKVEIAWKADRSRGYSLRLKWKEREGPPVVAPDRIGFGTKIIKSVFPVAETDYAADGLCFQGEIPLYDGETSSQQ